ncbi:MAG: type II secretion system F family protein [Actinobacteria bacterium]|nr:type II secretion system F family protein [Actinomycetota bacterium]
MIWALAAGASVGLGLVLLLRGAFPPRPALATSLAQLNRRVVDVDPALSTQGHSRGIEAVLGAPLGRLAGRLGLELRSVRKDLRVMGRPLERHLADKVLIALTGLLLPPAMAALFALGGWRLPVLVPLWGSILFAVGGFFLPDMALHSQAEQRRASFRYALGSFFDLVVITLAGGGGVQSALHDSAQVGQGWAYDQLQDALASSTRFGTPWAALGRLGEDLGIDELGELAASLGLAGTEGARVRESLAAKASSLRSHELASAESAAESASEKMAFPTVLLFVGFLIFLGYPAVDRVLSGI